MPEGDRLPDAIARCVLEKFDAWPANCKPRRPTAGSGLKQREWVPLAGIVAEVRGGIGSKLHCLTIATGMKCAPQAVLESSRGIIVHDSHAEVLAIRAFNRLLLEQCMSLVDAQPTDQREITVVERRQPSATDGGEHAPFQIRNDVKLHMYCSECPCGDASMELVMSRQMDATPWPAAATTERDEGNAMLGRGHFDQLGVVRRKPARADAPTVMSKSCSDKLALRQYTSLLSAITSLFIAPHGAYLSTIVLSRQQIIDSAMRRAFGRDGRLVPVSTWPGVGGYEFRPFQIAATDLAFAFSREAEHGTPRASNIACADFSCRREVLINSVLQGRKATDVQAAPLVSRRAMWTQAMKVASRMGQTELVEVLEQPTYGQLKNHSRLAIRREIKHMVLQAALSPWPRNHADTGWSLVALKEGQ